jgi:hypothetical protein
MSDPFAIALVGAIGGLISGVAASLIAPWVHWGVEKRRSRTDARRDLIQQARKAVLEAHDVWDRNTQDLAEGKVELKKAYPKALTYMDMLMIDERFQKARPHLTDPVLNGLAQARLLSLEDRGAPLGSMPKPFAGVLDDLARLEAKWELI